MVKRVRSWGFLPHRAPYPPLQYLGSPTAGTQGKPAIAIALSMVRYGTYQHALPEFTNCCRFQWFTLGIVDFAGARKGLIAGEVIMLIIPQTDRIHFLESKINLFIRYTKSMQIDPIPRFGNLLIPNKEMRTIPAGLIQRCIAVHDLTGIPAEPQTLLPFTLFLRSRGTTTIS